MKCIETPTFKRWLVFTTLLSGALFTGIACGSEELPYEDLEDVPQPSANRPSPPEEQTQANTNSTPTSSSASDPEDPNSSSTTDAADESLTYRVGYYDLDDQESLLYARVWKDPDTLLSGMAHDHVLRAAQWTGTIVYHPGELSQCSISFSLPVSELRNDEPAMRELVGLGDAIPESDREQIHEHMLGEDQLHESAHPTIDFESTNCRGNGGLVGEIQVTGNITIRGVTQTVTLPVDFQVSDDQLYATGEFEFNHSDFNFEPYSAFAGALANSQRLYMAFDVVGQSN